jgi:maltose alpha-D-glucosyltransferase/alpha-amylase
MPDPTPLPPDRAAPGADAPEVLDAGAGPRTTMDADGFAGELERKLPAILPRQRWFASKARPLRGVRITDTVVVPASGMEHGSAAIVLARCEFKAGEPELYAIPLIFRRISGATAPGPLAYVRCDGQITHELADGMSDGEFARALVRLALTGRSLAAGASRLDGVRVGLGLHDDSLHALHALDARTPTIEQSNSTVFFGDEFVFKLFRRLEEGVNPELEVGRHLAERARFTHAAPLVGAIDVVDASGERRTLGVAIRNVASRSDAWAWAQDRLAPFLAHAAGASGGDGLLPSTLPPGDVFEPAAPGGELRALLGDTPRLVRLLGKRTAEMHHALADDHADPRFTPEPFTTAHQLALHDTLAGEVRTTLDALRRWRSDEPDLQRLAQDVAGSETPLLRNLRVLDGALLDGSRIRLHGDYHLGQVLWTGDEFSIIDFEGEPMRTIAERRLKRSPLRDVAGMLRSFDYAAWEAIRRWGEAGGGGDASARTRVEAAGRAWGAWMSRAFVNGYTERLARLRPGLLGGDRRGNVRLLRAWLLEKALAEVLYEMNSRPAWIGIPLRALQEMAAGTGP